MHDVGRGFVGGLSDEVILRDRLLYVLRFVGCGIKGGKKVKSGRKKRKCRVLAKVS